MGILQGIFKPRDKPKNLGGGNSFLWGGSTSGKVVNEKTAMQMTAVYSCVRILSEAIAGLPLFVYKYGDDGSKEKCLEHPLWRVLHDEPNPEMTSFVFRETMMNHLLLTGNAYAQIIRNARGEVTIRSAYPSPMPTAICETARMFTGKPLMLWVKFKTKPNVMPSPCSSSENQHKI